MDLPIFISLKCTLDHFKVDCKAEELTQGQHLGISMMDTGLGKDFQTSVVLRVYYDPPTLSMSEVRLLSHRTGHQPANLINIDCMHAPTLAVSKL